MKQDLNITLVQANQIWEDKQANFANYERLLANASNTDLILLPEMFNTGFSMNASALAEKMDNSSSITWLKDLAKSKNAAVYTSLIIEENGSYFNRGLFVEPSGEIHMYDKRKTFGLAGEDKVFASGNQVKRVQFRGWNIQLQICYDLRFGEIAFNEMNSETGEANYDLLLYVANWPQRRIQHWKNILPARAIENQCYVAAVNRVGKDQMDLVYSGDSAILDLHGNRLVEIVDEEKIETITLSHQELSEWRGKLPFLKDREL